MPVKLDERYREAWQSSATTPDVFAFLSEHHASTPADKLTVVLTDQQLRWLTDNPLKVEEYLARIPELAADPELTAELVVGEYQARQDRDDSPSLEEFSARFADIGSKLQGRLRSTSSAQDRSANRDLKQRGDQGSVAQISKGYRLLKICRRSGVGAPGSFGGIFDYQYDLVSGGLVLQLAERTGRD